MPNNYVLLERIELNATATSVTFANIPQTGYTDLKIVTSVRDTAAVSSTDAPSYTILFNGSSANITQRQLISFQAGGNTAYSNSQMYTLVTGANNTANTFASADIYIPNYTSSNNKSVSIDVVGEGNTTSLTGISISANQWASSAAITSLQFNAYSSFAAGSSFSLYGIANVSTTPAIAPKANGGNVIGTDGTYWYHAFLSNGTFTPQVALNADVLVVAGGGGGGNSLAASYNAGGGGAGGVLALSSQALLATSYTCTVGSGGASNSNGSPTTIGSYTSNGGGNGGGGSNLAAGTGASGGGGRTGATGAASNASGGVLGFAGGDSTGAGNGFYGGGGGGAGAVGSQGNGSQSGNGGAGLNTWSSWLSATGLGVSGFIAGGGAGGGNIGMATGGSGGGGNGGYPGSAATYNAASGTVNTGSGGGGGQAAPTSGGYSGTGGAGGSGIVIVRYLVA